MPDETRNLTYVVRAREDATAVFDKVRGSYRSLKQETTGSGSFLGDLKEIAGSRGIIKDFAEIFAGGGAVAGLTFVGQQFKTVTEDILKYRDAMDSGRDSTTKMIDEIARGIPIYGNFFAGFRNIKELITGQEQADKKDLEAEQQRLALLDAQNKKLKDQANALDAVRDAAKASDKQDLDARRKNALAGLSDSLDRQQVQTQFDLEDAQRAIAEKFADLFKRAPEKQRGEVEAERDRELKRATEQRDATVERINREREEQARVQAEKDAQKQADETERQLKERRQVEQDQINEAQRRREEEARALESARISGKTTSAQAGLLSGARAPESAAETKISKNSDKQVELLERLANRRTIELAASTG